MRWNLTSKIPPRSLHAGYPFSAPPDEYDPTGHETFDSPYAVFADLRSRCPVAHSNSFDGFWAVTRYQDIHDILMQPDALHHLGKECGAGIIHYRSPASAASRSAGPYPLPQGHRSRAWRGPSDRHRGDHAPMARSLMQSLVAMGEADFIEHFSSPLPAAVFGEWLGLSEQQTRVLWRTAQAYVKAWESFDKSSVAAAAAQLAEMAAEVIAERQREPRDPNIDPTSSLLAARDARGSHFPEALLAGCVRQVLVVGLVAPPILLGSIAVHCRAIRSSSGSCGTIRRCSRCSRGVPAAVHALSRVRPLRQHDVTFMDAGSRPASPSRWYTPRPIATRPYSRNRMSSSCTDPISASTWHSDAGRTCVPASRLRARSYELRWKNCSRKPVTSRSVASSR